MAKLSDKILVVDADLNSLDLIAKQVLEPLGYQVALATDAGEAIQQALSFVPDVVIASLTLQGLSGKDLLTALRARGAEVPVIVIAPKGGEERILAAFRLGASDYLVRPLREAEIVATVDRVLGESRLRRERVQLQRQLTQANAELEQRVKELTTLSRIGRAVTSLRDMNLLFARLVENALLVTSAEMGWLVLVDEAAKQLILYAAKNMPARVLLHQPWDDGLASLVVLSGQPLNIVGPGMAQFKIAEMAQSALVMPIRAREQTLGVVTVANRAPRPFSGRHQDLLGAVADYASIAIVNVRLFQALEARARSLQQAYDELKAGQSGKDLVLQKVVQDLRGPMGQAKYYVDMVLNELSGKISERHQKALQLAIEQLTALTRTVDDLSNRK